jgi:hypothetical protein
MPRDVTALWTFVAELDHDSRMALFAHCVALTVNAVRLPWERRPRAQATADKLAEAVSLDMTGYWRPTVRTYLGRITKARIQAQLEKFRSDAAECTLILIRDLATDKAKRELFARLADHLNGLAEEVERAISAKAARGES